MPTRPDPLSRPGVQPDRVVYATGALLDADDFLAEQTYHRGRLARALSYLEGSGTVAGLRVRIDVREEEEGGEEAGEERVFVEPGMALDRLGRIVEVPRLACLRLGRWLEAQPQSRRVRAFFGPGEGPLPPAERPASEGYLLADVFVRFQACERGFTPAFATGPFDALDAVAPSRVRDGYELSLRLREEDLPPLPVSPWPAFPGGATPEERLEILRNAVLDLAWQGGTLGEEDAGLNPAPEHALGQDPTDVFLARLVIPARRAANPVRSAAQPVVVDNLGRRFVFPSGALAHWLAV